MIEVVLCDTLPDQRKVAQNFSVTCSTCEIIIFFSFFVGPQRQDKDTQGRPYINVIFKKQQISLNKIIVIAPLWSSFILFCFSK